MVKIGCSDHLLVGQLKCPMSQHTDPSAMQATLQSLNNFLGQVVTQHVIAVKLAGTAGHLLPAASALYVSMNPYLQTYITICEEVARAEYAVQADMRILRELESQVTNSFETDQEVPCSVPVKAYGVQNKLSILLCKHCSQHTEHSCKVLFLAAGASAATTAPPDLATALPAAAHHDKLQAVLAQARAIRGQPKTSTANRSYLSPIQPEQSKPSAPVTPTQGTPLHASTSKHACSTKPEAVTDSKRDRVSSNSRQCHRSSKFQPPTAQQAGQQLPEKLLPGKRLPSGKSTATQASPTPQSDIGKEASSLPVPLQLPADFTKALHALRYVSAHQVLPCIPDQSDDRFCGIRNAWQVPAAQTSISIVVNMFLRPSDLHFVGSTSLTCDITDSMYCECDATRCYSQLIDIAGLQHLISNLCTPCHVTVLWTTTLAMTNGITMTNGIILCLIALCTAPFELSCQSCSVCLLVSDLCYSCEATACVDSSGTDFS